MDGQKIVYGTDLSPPVGGKEIYRVYSHKPFALFQDSLLIYKDRVTFVFRDMLDFKRVVTEPVKQIVEVEVFESFFWCSLKIVTRSRIETEITNLRKIEAQRARRVIMRATTQDADIM